MTMSEAEPPVGPEPEIIVGYKLGLGVAARLAESIALGIEQQAGAAAATDDLRIPLLRSLASTFRGEADHFEWQRVEALRREAETLDAKRKARVQ